MNLEANPAEVIEDDRHRERCGNADPGEHTGTKPLRQHQARDSGRDADQAAHPGPPRGSSQFLTAWPSLTNNYLNEKNANQSGGVNPKGSKHGLSNRLA